MYHLRAHSIALLFTLLHPAATLAQQAATPTAATPAAAPPAEAAPPPSLGPDDAQRQREARAAAEMDAIERRLAVERALSAQHADRVARMTNANSYRYPGIALTSFGGVFLGAGVLMGAVTIVDALFDYCELPSPCDHRKTQALGYTSLGLIIVGGVSLGVGIDLLRKGNRLRRDAFLYR